MKGVALFLLPLLGFAAGCKPESPDMYGPEPVRYGVKQRAEADGTTLAPEKQNGTDGLRPLERGQEAPL